MNKEMKSRGITITGEWIYGYYVQDTEWAKHYIFHQKHTGAFYQLKSTQVSEKGIGYNSTLKDINQKEIYSGDIISIPYIDPMGNLTEDEDFKTVVIFNYGSFGYMTEGGKVFNTLNQWCKRGEKDYIPNYGEHFPLLNDTLLTVIGNVYENPELL